MVGFFDDYEGGSRRHERGPGAGGEVSAPDSLESLSFDDGDQKLKTNGNDVCLVNTAIWLRYLTQLDEKLEPEIGAYCDEGGMADSFDAELIAKFDILDGHESHV